MSGDANQSMEPAAANRHGRSPKGELSGESESIEPKCEPTYQLSSKPECDDEAGAGIEPAMRPRSHLLIRSAYVCVCVYLSIDKGKS
jgi:hypothetical protein